MAYYDAIANAIGARGNALAQGALQSGQVWGNLAANLGQIPGQAIAFHQQRQDALQNHEIKKMALEKAQRTANMEKDLIRVINSGLPKEQMWAEAKRIASQDPEEFLRFQQLESQEMFRQQQADAQRYKLLEGQPGTQVPQGPLALPEPTRGVTTPDVGLGTGGVRNAFAPPIPIEGQMVHQEIPGLGAPPTDMQQHQQKVAKIKSLGLDPQTEKLAIEALVVPASILSAQARGSAAPGVGLTVIELTNPNNPGEKMLVQSTRGGPFVHSGTQQLVPEEIATTWHKRIVSQPKMVVGSNDQPIVLDIESQLAQQRNAGQIASTIPGVTVRQAAPPATTLTTITGPEGPKVVEYQPVRGKGQKGKITTVAENSVKGTVPGVGETLQKEVAGLGTAATSLNKLYATLPNISGGPVWGTLRKVQLNSLGGWGSTPEEVQAATQINLLMRSAFDTAGANFTEHEMNIFRGIYPQQTDTVETAMTKIPEALAYIKERLELRQGLITPMQRTQTKFPQINVPGDASNSVKVRLPNGSVGTIPRQNLEAAKQRGAVEVP